MTTTLPINLFEGKSQKDITVALESFQEDLNEIANALETENWRAAKEAADFVKGAVPPVPSASGAPYPWKSQKQRWFVIMSIQEGSIVVPYRRTNSMVRKIYTKVEKVGDTAVGIIGNSIDYAPWVISDEKLSDGRGAQSAYHSGTWYTLQGVVRDNQPGIEKIFEHHMKEVFG